MLSLRGFQSSVSWMAWVDMSCLNGVFCSWVYCREGMRSIVSPLECTPTPHPSCEPALVQLKPVPSVLCGIAFPVGLQSWLSFWRVFQSRSYEIPGPESIPAIFQAERGQQLIYIPPYNKSCFRCESWWNSIYEQLSFHPCWPPPPLGTHSFLQRQGLQFPHRPLDPPLKCTYTGCAADTLSPPNRALQMWPAANRIPLPSPCLIPVQSGGLLLTPPHRLAFLTFGLCFYSVLPKMSSLYTCTTFLPLCLGLSSVFQIPRAFVVLRYSLPSIAWHEPIGIIQF